MEEEIPVWERQEGEPARWYGLFAKYYLAAGPGRSVREAFLRFVKEFHADKLEEAKLRRGAPPTWVRMALEWKWRDRANAWEEYQTKLAMAVVEDAAKRLRLSTALAVDTLILSLASERLKVQAAKEILDRGGLPSTTKVETDNTVTFTADDMAKARAELDAWEKSMLADEGPEP